ncbi:catalase family protein [Polymorphobacter sp. PAMC 29334]|uniref:catalase family protein n=1 Tax=Polymorphobacter sp. PAMC 29334 TaxID=2862331 RepID=UPI001C78B6A2|nr:catalase family protein [Polymorphobacter sp. PAMC 29334]QYE36264.1 catalase family protein [Polymorphobacter sp. PAMC 29334]
MPAVRFTPSVETPAADEAETIAGLTEAMESISATTFKDEAKAIRAVHAKSHALLEGELTIFGGLAPELAQGLFAKPGTYKTSIRLSTSPGDLMDDHVSTPRGIAIKIHGVDGDQLSGSATDTTQDFLMVEGPTFAAATPKDFLGTVKMLAATTDKAEGLKRAFSATARGIEALLEAVGSKSGTLVALGGHKLTNPLGETFYTQVPVRYGDYIAKLACVPVGALAELKDAKVESDHQNFLREAIGKTFANGGGEWEIRVQLCTDLEKMPIEDASVEWPEDASPYVTVARLRAAAQPSWSIDQVHAIDDGLAFSPWHGLAAHQPLGGVMRARKSVYATLQGERSARSGCPFSEEARHAAG